jgi:hypothetical protein
MSPITWAGFTVLLIALPVFYVLLRIGSVIIGALIKADYNYRRRSWPVYFIDTSSRPYRCEWRKPPPSNFSAAINKLVRKFW